MSMHKIPLTELEREGLNSHRLVVAAPSQLSDCFRLGMKWAQDNASADGWIHIDVKPELHQAVLCKTEYADGTPAALIRHWNGKSGFLGEGGKKDKFVKGWMPLPSVE